MPNTYPPLQLTKPQLEALVQLGYENEEIDGVAIMEIVALAVLSLKHPFPTTSPNPSTRKK